MAHSRYLCKRLYARFPELNIVIGLWAAKVDLKKARDRVACAGTVQVTSRLAHALDQVGQMVQPVVVASEQERIRGEAEADAQG